MDALCPQCQHEMVWQSPDRFYCSRCDAGFYQEARCPDCRELLQVMSACGSVSYFCTHGHSLISKGRVLFRYVPATA